MAVWASWNDQAAYDDMMAKTKDRRDAALKAEQEKKQEELQNRERAGAKKRSRQEATDAATPEPMDVGGGGSDDDSGSDGGSETRLDATPEDTRLEDMDVENDIGGDCGGGGRGGSDDDSDGDGGSSGDSVGSVGNGGSSSGGVEVAEVEGVEGVAEEVAEEVEEAGEEVAAADEVADGQDNSLRPRLPPSSMSNGMTTVASFSRIKSIWRRRTLERERVRPPVRQMNPVEPLRSPSWSDFLVVCVLTREMEVLRLLKGCTTGVTSFRISSTTTTSPTCSTRSTSGWFWARRGSASVARSVSCNQSITATTHLKAKNPPSPSGSSWKPGAMRE